MTNGKTLRLLSYIAKRIMLLISSMLGLIILLFLLTRALPGDPARLALGPSATKEMIENLRHMWGLDQPLHIQFLNYLKDVISGNWGKSIVTWQYVISDLARYVPATLELTIIGMTIAIIMGTFLGVISAHHKNKWPDHLARVFALFGNAFPRFWLGIFLQIIVAFTLKIFPIYGRIAANVKPPTSITGLYLLDSLLTLNWTAFQSSLHHIILPAITYSIGPLAYIAQLTRSAMIEESTKDYVTSVKANGLPESLITYVYMLRNALIPALTIITMSFAQGLSGSILVEAVFNWPGMGAYLISAIMFTDINAIVGASIVVGLAVAISNMVADILYGYIDPRIRYGEASSR
jgi:peptide/nickel transport system permease protein